MIRVWLWLLIVTPLQAEELRPVTLEDCFNQALHHFESVQIQEQEIRAAEARYYQALGGVLPELSAIGTEFIQDTSGVATGGDEFGSTFVRQSRPELAINLKQPLFQGFREFKALSVSTKDRKKMELETERAKQLLFLDVVKIYLSIQELEKDLSIVHSEQGVTKKRLGELNGRIRLGKSRKSEVLTTESQLALLDADISQGAGRLKVARETLAFLTGLVSDQPLADLTTTGREPEPIDHYLNRATERADLKAANLSFELSQAKLAYEKGGYLPQLNLEANYYPYRVGFQSEIDWDLLLSLEIPLFKGGTTRGLVREARARQRQEELRRRETARRATLEVRQAYHDWIAAREGRQALQNAAQKAAQNYQVQVREYRLGLVNNLEVLQALRDWHEIERQMNRAIFQVALNEYRLKVASGAAP